MQTVLLSSITLTLFKKNSAAIFLHQNKQLTMTQDRIIMDSLLKISGAQTVSEETSKEL